ncbi:winged helix-turn-helix domain-containing protein [Enterococcus sp. HY326]|uniref:winged helix-turn-helix domain-containing protein n=1 Tax=Enterococcus sp. HY326 TaxID=2971265 RepID=UPI002240AF01|nr:LysR family transcriptional regulator [Enterococcus sp. HY326]
MTVDFDYTLSLKLRKEKNFFGPGVIQLLQEIEQSQSLNVAAKKMQMSYSKAWRIIQYAERELGYSLIDRSVGGNSGGGSTVTEAGKKITQQYLSFEQKMYARADQLFQEIFVEELEAEQRERNFS